MFIIINECRIISQIVYLNVRIEERILLLEMQLLQVFLFANNRKKNELKQDFLYMCEFRR